MTAEIKNNDLENERDALGKKLVVFGRDVGQIPCFRNSFLYGIVGGFASGIAAFGFTSKVRKSTNIGFYTYIGITFTYWAYCRWDYSNTKFQYAQLQHALKLQSKYEGTSKDIKNTVVTDEK